MSEIKQVTDWIDAAQQEPSTRNIANYLAYNMSELAECLKSIDHIAFTMLSSRLETFSLCLREAVYDDEIRDADRTELLDGAVDAAWCAIGLAHMLADAQGAFNEVAASNYSKFECGVCQIDSTGKVVKGPGYFKPDLAKYLR